ncbi:MAG TPA: serine hydrolase domain-containing protein, partial [Allosphingosinicella sp.]
MPSRWTLADNTIRLSGFCMFPAMLAALPGCITPAGSPPVMVSRAGRAAEVPATPASRLDAYIAAHNSGELEAARALFTGHFAPSALAAASAADRAGAMVQTRAITGPLRLHSSQTTGTKTSALLQSEATDEWFKLELEVAPEPPSLITRASFDFADEPAGFRSTAPISDSELAAEAREYAERLSRAGMFPGTFLVARGEQVLVKLDTRPAGGADGAAARPPQDILSVGKLFTIIAVAQLEQRGLLRLSDTVGKFLPDYPNRDVADNVTIGQLLTHTAGIPDYMGDPDYQAARSASPGRRIPTTSGYLPYFANRPLEFRPGARRSYSNSGYVVVARIIEAITGSPFADYVALRILAPAGMSSTSAATV